MEPVLLSDALASIAATDLSTMSPAPKAQIGASDSDYSSFLTPQISSANTPTFGASIISSDDDDYFTGPNLHSPAPAKTDPDTESEVLLKSFQTSTLLTPQSPRNTTATASALPETDLGLPNMDASISRVVKRESDQDDLTSPSPRARPISPVSDVRTSLPGMKQEAATESAGVLRDNDKNVIPALLTTSIGHSTEASLSPDLSSEEALVLSLRSKVQEAHDEEQQLKCRAESVESDKEGYEIQVHRTHMMLQVTVEEVEELKEQKMEIIAKWRTALAERRAIEALIKKKEVEYDEKSAAKKALVDQVHAKHDEHKSAICEVHKAAKRRRDLEKELEAAEYEARFVKECPDAGFRQFVRDTTEDRARHRLLNDTIKGEAMVVDLGEIEIMLEQAADRTKADIKPRDERAKTEQIEPQAKAEFVKVEPESSNTPAPTSTNGCNASPTAQGILDTVRQIQTLQMKLQAQLQKVNSFKRKRDDDEVNIETRPPPIRAKPSRFSHESDIDSEVGGPEGKSSDEDERSDEEESEDDQDKDMAADEEESEDETVVKN